MKIKKTLAVLLGFLLMFANVQFVGATTISQGSQHQANTSLNKANLVKNLIKRNAFNKKTGKKPAFKDTDKVRIIVELKGESPIEYATKNKKLYKQLSEKTKKSLTKSVLSQQKQIKESIANKGIKLQYKSNFTTVFNGFSGQATYGDIAKIESIKGVKNVYISNEYNRPQEKPNMTKSHQFIQTLQTWGDAHFKGEGQVISIIDTGVDPSHQDFNITDPSKEALNEDKVNSLIDDNGLNGQFYTNKVPYGYNYYDLNNTILDLGPSATMHGMHVAGIAAANGDTNNGGIKGVAPEAQVLAMKVFSNDPLFPSTFSDVYLAAIDDSIKLGADVINMSLGSTAAFYEANSPEDIAITRATDNGIVCSVSAGNSGEIGNGFDKKPDSNNPDIGTVGAPGLNKDAISVAASGNEAYLYEHKITIDGAPDFSAMGYGLDSWTDLAGKQIVSLNGATGNPGDYDGVDVTGKVVLVQRGDISFYDKTVNAAAAGAAGIIVYDNGQGAPFYKDQGEWQIPFMNISYEDGQALRNVIENQNLTTLGIEQTSKSESPDMGRMTEFSSWGTTPSLGLKPEITAPGGNIYSTLQDGQYGVMSGTSMAAPMVSGGSALVQQYLKTDSKFTGLSASQRARLTKVLLMNTAKVILDTNGIPFSPRRQGAGMMQTFSAVSTPVTVVNADTKEAKVELKDFKDTKKSFTLTATNYSDKDITYNVNTQLLADTIQATDGQSDQNALTSGKIQDATITGDSTVTVPAGKSVNFTVGFDLTNAKLPGIDKDGNPTTYPLKDNVFVEGFVSLTGTGDAAVKPVLSVPFVGFYGEWDQPSILDGFKDLGENQYFAVDGVSDMLSDYDLFNTSPVPTKGYYALSPNGDGILDNINPLPTFLRNAKEVQFNVLDQNKNLLRRVLTEENVIKNFYDDGNGSPFSENVGSMWDGKVKSQTLPDGQYYYEIKSVIDYPGAKWQTKDIPVYIDTKAPSVEITANDGKGNITWSGTDDGVGIAGYAVLVNGELEADLPADTTSYQVNGYIDGDAVQVMAYDYAGNYGTAGDQADVEGAPMIYALSPAPYGASNSRTVPVYGYVDDNQKVQQVTINGTPADLVTSPDSSDIPPSIAAKLTAKENIFVGMAKFDSDGKFDVDIKATDVSGNEFSITRKVFIDTTNPTLTTDAPQFVDQSVDKVNVNINMKDNFNYLSLYVDDNHEFESPVEDPVVLAQPGSGKVATTLDLKPGNNTFTLTLTDIAGNKVVKELNIYRNDEKARVNRVSGSTRYDTALAVSQKGWTTSDTVVLARGDSYSDALAAVPLAKKYNAPLLLTKPDVIDDSILNEIDRLQAKKVIIIGGEGAVSSDIEGQLEDNLGVDVQRIAGTNRYDTAAKIAKEVAPDGSDQVVVVSGRNFPDAISVASFAAAKGFPILLTESNSLPTETAAAIKQLGATKSLVIGGDGVIKANVESALPNAFRIGGTTRYDTGIKVAKYFNTQPFEYFVATGKSFADAMAGSALAAKEGTGILLTDTTLPSVVENFVKDNHISKLSVLGGKGAVSDTVISKLNSYLK